MCIKDCIKDYNKSFMFVRVLFPPESTETFVYKGDMLIKN